MKEKHNKVVDNVCNWFKFQIPNCKIQREKQYKISLQDLELNKQYFIVDIIVTDIDKNQEIGVECKSLADSKNFRGLCAGIGQAWVLKRRFGLSYLAIEVNQEIFPENDPFKFYKRVALLPNANVELGIGILTVNENDIVTCVGEAKYEKPASVTLFTPRKKELSE